MKLNLSDIKQVFFVGIGGIGMSAIARYFNSIGISVYGYDRVCSPISTSLEEEGISIVYDDDIDSIPKQFENKESSLIVYTPAIPKTNKILEFFKNSGLVIKKRSEILGLIASNKKLLGVAGTHGKTTVSTMVAHNIKNSNVDCSAFLGGISKNYSSNLILPKNNNTQITVMEADEFDRSFLQLYPDIAVITSIEADHLDIYGSKEELQKAFNQYIGQIRENGILIFKYGLDINCDKIKSYTYSYDNEESDFYISDLKIENGKYIYNLHTPFGEISQIIAKYPGKINIENSVAAAAASLCAGVLPNELKSSIASFSGVKRRFDVQIDTKELVFIDDYAHHPDELNAIISSVKELYPNKIVCGIFQPHLYTRTRDFSTAFGKALNLLDKVYLLDIYPARELPIEGINSSFLSTKIDKGATVLSKSELLDAIEKEDFDVLLTLGAGDIDRLVEPIANRLKK